MTLALAIGHRLPEEAVLALRLDGIMRGLARPFPVGLRRPTGRKLVLHGGGWIYSVAFALRVFVLHRRGCVEPLRMNERPCGRR